MALCDALEVQTKSSQRAHQILVKTCLATLANSQNSKDLLEQDVRPSSRRLFDAQKYAELLAEIPTLVGPKAMREAMGATLSELSALEDENHLIPRTRIAKVKNPWRISDGTTFVAEILIRAILVEDDNNSWENLLLARRRSEVGLSNLIQAIRAGQISVGQRTGVSGFHGIVVHNSEVDLLASSRLEPQKTNEIPPPGEISAAEFGRTVGLRDHGRFIALVEAGHTPGFQCIHPSTKRIQYRLSANDISSFHLRLVTLTTLIEETGYHRNTLKSLLAATRVNRFSPEGQDFGPVYLREEAIKALK